MQPPRGSGSAEPTRGDGGGLARYRSAPATWLEALLESDEEQVLPDVVLDIPKPPPPPNASSTAEVDLQLLESAGGGSFSNFLRMNSSPAEFLSLLNSSEGLFSNLGIPADYELLPANQGKRAREAEDLDGISPKKSPSSSSSTQVKREKRGQLQGSGGSFDLDMENILEDSVMCRVRAKRGCATHPRSIAERERRTRISDRIRKLQELVPNMDKQTNTADMLEEAVAYVKHLQKEIQDLTEHQKKCTCSTND
ncbi:transcription factor bHLH80-like [Salvia splendens]|uniref:transcription factor bHLH80-like n=1 Tax=Salvia splendens TaxID=180675 RepID=UPI001C2715EE|nr:transcription factor bHLH80-like [Salvia splendens]XP_042062986.1 transcription factor bHLH80-like [Salvia splendens]